MKAQNVLLLGAAVGALAAAIAGPASAGAFYIQEQSVKGLGRAYSGEAADTGAEGLWWNPAAIGEVQGVEIANGLHAVMVDGRSDDDGTTITRPLSSATSVGGEPRAYKPVLFGVVPNFDAAWRVNNLVSLGLAVNAPFNATTKYSDTSWARYQGEKTLIFDIDIQPTVALHLNRYVDVGVGFDAQYVSSTLTQALPNISPLLPDGQQSLSGDGWDYGWNAGLQLHPNDRLSFGASYRSMIKHTLDGTIAVTALQGTAYAESASGAGSATFKTPWIATLGARFRATDRLAVNAQVQRFGWSVFDAIRVTSSIGNQVVAQNYRDTTNVSVGADYDVNPMWTVRGGVQYDPTPTPDAGRTVRIPDSDRFLFSVGSTIKPSQHLSFDIAAAYIDFEGSRVSSETTAYSGTALVTPVDIEGNVSGSGVILSVGGRLTF